MMIVMTVLRLIVMIDDGSTCDNNNDVNHNNTDHAYGANNDLWGYQLWWC